MGLRTLPVLTRTLLLTTVAVGTLTPASLAVAGAASPPSAKTSHHARNAVTEAEAFFTCGHDQTRFDRIQRIKHTIGQEMASIKASENLASKADKPSLVTYWKFDMTQRQHYETYLVKYWHSDFDKRKKYEIYVLNLHKKGDAVTKGEARLKTCKLTKLTFPPSKAAPAKPPASTPTTKPAAKTPPKSSSTTTAPKSSSTSTTAPPKSPSTTTPPASSTTTTGPASSTTTTGPAANSTAPGSSTPGSSSTTGPPAPTTTSGT